jgi:prepilin-type N-terminal cleavage/methylation domain-containing protein
MFKLIKNNGFTLIELLLVIGIASLFALTVFALSNMATSSQMVNIETRNISAIRGGIKSLYGGGTTYAGINAQTVLNNWIPPDNMRSPAGIAATSIINSFGGTVDVQPYNYNGGASNAFSIIESFVPNDVCPKIVASTGYDFNVVTVNGTVVKDTSSTSTSYVNVPLAASSCNSGATSTIIFSSI